MWMAWLTRRFPRLLSRWTLRARRPPRWARCRCRRRSGRGCLKRETSRTSPMMTAAMTGPTPNRPVRLVPLARDRGGELLPGLAQLGVDAAQVLDEGRGELPAGGRDRVRRRDRVQQPGGAGRDDLLRDAAGDQLAEHRVQPADDLGAAAGPGHGGAWTRPSAPPRGHRAGPRGRRASAARRPRPTGRRWGRSCSRSRWPAAAPGRPAWAARPAPAPRPTAAAGPAGAPGRRRPRPPRSAPARPRPIPAAARPARRWRAPAARPAAPRPPLIATAVCEALCGSIPIITAAMTGLLFPGPAGGPRRARLIPGP